MGFKPASQLRIKTQLLQNIKLVGLYFPQKRFLKCSNIMPKNVNLMLKMIPVII